MVPEQQISQDVWDKWLVSDSADTIMNGEMSSLQHRTHVGSIWI